MNQLFFVYYLRCPKKKTIKYIGASTNIKRRYDQHLKGRNNSTKKWIIELNSENKTPIIEVVFTGNREESLIKEKELIKENSSRKLLNILWNYSGILVYKETIKIKEKPTMVRKYSF